jgi:LacI family transcriptional regulator
MSHSKTADEQFNVGVFLDLSTGSGRAMMEGIGRHLVTRRNWSLCLNPLAKDGTVPFCVKLWPGHGVIAQVQTASDARLLRQLDMPIVDVGGTITHEWPRVGPDELAIARLAIEHLRLHGAQHFAFVSYAGSPTPTERHSAYEHGLKRLGIECATHTMLAPPQSLTPAAKGRANAQSILKLESWLCSLTQPCGILAANDVVAQLVTKSCRTLGIACPDDILVLGVDNDVPLCVLSDPPLSSIESGWEQVGYEAASLLTAFWSSAKQHPNIRSCYLKALSHVARLTERS